MSSGGVFTLITNDGAQDKIIMATDKLMQALTDISKRRIASLRTLADYQNMTDQQIMTATNEWFPTLPEIERTHSIFVNSVFKPYVSIAHEYIKTPAKGTTLLGSYLEPTKQGSTVKFTLPVQGQLTSDAVVHLRITGLSAISNLDKVKFVDFIGHRIFRNVRFVLNEVVLDEYTADRYNIYWQWKLPAGKETGYMRCVGQEVPHTGYLVADPAVDEVRQYVTFGDGPQTFKNVQPTLDLWIPMLFWWKDVMNALPNYLFPYGQTNIEIDLENETNLVSYAKYSGLSGKIYNSPVISTCELYVSNIYVLPEIAKILKYRFGFQLVRVTKTHKAMGVTNPADRIQLNQIKFPVEAMYVGFRPVANLSYSQRWYRNVVLTERLVPMPIVVGAATVEVNNAAYLDEAAVVAKVGIDTMGIGLYPQIEPTFYNSYLPFKYGQQLKTPRDIGWMMFNFNFYPAENQPSGYINTSQTREFYLNYVSDTDTNGNYLISNSNPVDVLIVADCINLLLSDSTGKGATMKFAT